MVPKTLMDMAMEDIPLSRMMLIYCPLFPSTPIEHWKEQDKITIKLLRIRFVLSFLFPYTNMVKISIKSEPFHSNSCPEFLIYSGGICFQFFILISKTNLTHLIFRRSVSDDESFVNFSKVTPEKT